MEKGTMKAIIVDDEQHVLDAVMLLVPWGDLGISAVFTAQSVEQAINLLDQERPEIAIVDVVIGNELGEEIARHIRDRGLPTKVIVISGHDDYAYIRSMFVLGSVDYLLKPIEQEAIVGAVRATIAKITAQGEQNEALPLYHQLSDLRRDSLCTQLLQPELRETAYRELCSLSELFRQADRCTVLYSSLLFFPAQQKNEAAARQWLELARRALPIDRGILVQRAGRDLVILLLSETPSEYDGFLRFCKECCCGAFQAIRFGCSQALPFPQNIPEALEQARIAFSAMPMDGGQTVVRYEDGQRDAAIPVDIHLENRLFSALLIGDEAKLLAALQKWLEFLSGHAEKTRGELTGILAYACALCDKWGRYLASRYPGFACAAIPEPAAFSEAARAGWDATFRKLEQLLGQCLLQMYHKKRQLQSSSDSMQEIADYLMLNYRQEFHQTELAALFHINKDYMSRRFKETYGVGMVSYVNDLRIRRAEELLVGSNMRVQEIAAQVGFTDEKYFAKIFRRAAGCSPLEYRLRSDQRTGPE